MNPQVSKLNTSDKPIL